MASSESDWISLSNEYNKKVFNSIHLGGCNILYHAIQSNKLVMYNSDNHKWIDFIEYPPEFRCVAPVMALDDTKQKLFLYGEGSLLIVNTKTKDTQLINGIDPVGCRNSSALLIKDKFHIFGGGTGEDKHYIFNRQTRKMDSIYQFDGVYSGGFSFQRTVYLPQKDIIFMIGGFGDKTCDSSDEIWCYDHKNWKLLDLALPVGLDAFGCVVTKNEKYIIIFGGDDTFGRRRDAILLIDVETMSIHESCVRCPVKAQFDAVVIDFSVKDEMLVHGYIRWCWTLDMFEGIGFPSMDVINLMVMWYNEEYVYLKEKYNTRHWKMRLTNILELKNITHDICIEQCD